MLSGQHIHWPGVLLHLFWHLYGMVGALQFEVLMALVGTEKFSSAIGLVLLVEAMAVLVGPPGAGRLLDATHQYMHAFLLAGAEVTLSALLLALGNFLCIKTKRSSPPASTTEMKVRAAEKDMLHYEEVVTENEKKDLQDGREMEKSLGYQEEFEAVPIQTNSDQAQS
ncbi:hypothetical protein WMY93_010804 [Mugilogobius chulae]|uniref:Uncharacterized protein n=1 Tax=Mugilogobius chulae TaxID=88201 RepID=A0AAW0P8Q0_9GOBI